LLPVNALNRVDFPTFGSPTIPIDILIPAILTEKAEPDLLSCSKYKISLELKTVLRSVQFRIWYSMKDREYGVLPLKRIQTYDAFTRGIYC
jgi:hypothetical protein